MTADDANELSASLSTSDLLGFPVPEPVKRSAWKAIGRLIGVTADAAADQISAWGNNRAAQIASRGQSAIALRQAATQRGIEALKNNPDTGDIAVGRYLSELQIKQENREAIAELSLKELKNLDYENFRKSNQIKDTNSVNEAEISDDWLLDFGDSIENVGDEQVRHLDTSGIPCLRRA